MIPAEIKNDAGLILQVVESGKLRIARWQTKAPGRSVIYLKEYTDVGKKNPKITMGDGNPLPFIFSGNGVRAICIPRPAG
jgi:hypothetical protein